MARCFRFSVPLLAALLTLSAAAQTVPPVGTASTLDVATWNIEWFGSTLGGPTNEALQQENALDVIAQSEVDVWALQEIASTSAFNDLLADLGSGWAGYLATASGDQRTAVVYKAGALQNVTTTQILEGNADDFGGRPPLQIEATATVGSTAMPLVFVIVHMKAGDTASDYAKRVAASQALKAYIDGRLASGDHVVLLGDLNDELLESISGSAFSPYDNFLADDDYRFLTEPFDQEGDADDENTYCFNTSCSSGSVLDHIVITANLDAAYVSGSVARYEALLDVFDAHGGEFVTTTSDHLPVYARFALTPVPNEPSAAAPAFGLGAPYPNPFTTTATLTYTLDRPGPVRLELFDALGRRVSVIEDDARPAGTYRVRFNANALVPGLYVVRLTSGDRVVTRRLVRGS